MTYPRSHLVDLHNGGAYHCTSRCVRRAWLCGVDPSTGIDYSHRRRWLEKRILMLAQVFAVDLHGYAVMSNHYHVVVRIKPRVAARWSDAEVVDRWLALARIRDASKRIVMRKQLLQDPARVTVLRGRLGDLSWFMRYINEAMARRCNREDDCKGRFWQGRFASSALLDEAALLACMAYVDLNPVRAGVTQDVRQTTNTSIARRLRRGPSASVLAPLRALGISLRGYVELLRMTAQRFDPDAGRLKCSQSPVLRRARASPERWLRCVGANRRQYRAYGSLADLQSYAHQRGQSWIRGMRVRAG